MAQQETRRRRRVDRPPGPYGSEWVIVWAMCLLTLACMVIALAVGTRPAKAELPFELHLPDGTVQLACGSPSYTPDVKLFQFDPCPDIFSDGFEAP